MSETISARLEDAKSLEHTTLKRLIHLIRMRRRWFKIPESQEGEPWIKYMDSLAWDEQQAETSFWRAANRWYTARQRLLKVQKEG